MRSRTDAKQVRKGVSFNALLGIGKKLLNPLNGEPPRLGQVFFGAWRERAHSTCDVSAGSS